MIKLTTTYSINIVKIHLENKKIILGVASVWTEKKGLNDFIELSKVLDDNYKIVLVGLNKKQLKDGFHNLPDIIRLGHCVVVNGWCTMCQ